MPTDGPKPAAEISGKAEPRMGATMLRDYAGVMVCSVTVVSFISIGFVMMAIKVMGSSDAAPPGEWMAAMLSLASTALGFLAGQRTPAPGAGSAPGAKKEEARCACDSKAG